MLCFHRLLLVVALLLASSAPPALAQTAEADSLPAPATEPGWLDALARRPVTGELILLGGATGHALTAPLRWGGEEILVLGLAAGGVAAVSLLDEAGRDLMARNRSDTNEHLEELVEPFGRMRGLQVLGGLYAAGLLLDDARLRGAAAEGLASGLVAAGIFQPALAEVSGRPRPRKGRPAHTFDPFSGNISFPSGHTTAAFAFASVIATEYPHPLVSAPAYGLASAVGLARMYSGAHFLSDVVAAGVLGTVVGRAVARYGQRHRERLRVVPAVHGGEAALAVQLRF